MNLKFITFEPDYTQFIVNTETDANAIKQAIEANLTYDNYDEEFEKDIRDKSNYNVEDIDSMNFLADIINRNDLIGVYNGVIVLNG